MPAEQPITGAYFETPARAERLQLLFHLVRNASDVIYLRAPAGAGKTRFVRRLVDDLGEEMATVWIRAGRDDDIPSAAVAQLGLDSHAIIQWPETALDAAGDRDFLVIVDDADRIDLAAVEDLAALHAKGGRLLLIGHGGMTHTAGKWDAQFVDLPSFDVQQATAFLRAQAGEKSACVTEDLAAALHRAAHGLPGPLLEALSEVLLRARKPRPEKRTAATTPPGHGWPVWQWLTGGVVLVMLAAALVFQDHINALFQPAAEERPYPVVEHPTQTEKAIKPGPAFDQPTAGVPAQPPEIALPEMSQVPADVAADPPPSAPAETRAAPRQASSESTAVLASKPSAVTAAQSPAVGEDPLESVMRDAISAAHTRGAVVPSDEKPLAATQSQQKEAVAAAPALAATQPATSTAVYEPVPAQQPESQVRGQPAVVEVRPLQAAPAPLPAKPVKASSRPAAAPVETRPAKVAEAASPSGGGDWLRSREQGRYTLQLVGARDRASIEKFVRKNAIKQPYAIFERDLEGRPWYSLVAGDYRDRDAAIAARGRLPRPLQQSGVWPRTFESIQKAN